MASPKVKRIVELQRMPLNRDFIIGAEFDANFNSIDYIQTANAAASISCEDSIATLFTLVAPTLRASVSAAVSQAAHRTDVSCCCWRGGIGNRSGIWRTQSCRKSDEHY
jgi:hypothetical protein